LKSSRTKCVCTSTMNWPARAPARWAATPAAGLGPGDSNTGRRRRSWQEGRRHARRCWPGTRGAQAYRGRARRPALDPRLERRCSRVCGSGLYSPLETTWVAARSWPAVAGMAAAFLAMNDVFDRCSRSPGPRPAARRRRPARRRPGRQFIVDVQTHFVRDDFKQAGHARPREVREEELDPASRRERPGRYKFENYVREVFVDSDTKVALLSGAPFDDSTWDLLTNDQIAAAVPPSIASPPRGASSARRLHARKNGWMGEVDRAIAELKRTAGRATRSATAVPVEGRLLLAARRRQADVSVLREDLEGASTPCASTRVCCRSTTRVVAQRLAVRHRERPRQGGKDWPQINFVIYHSALRAFLEPRRPRWPNSTQTGRIKWPPTSPKSLGSSASARLRRDRHLVRHLRHRQPEDGGRAHGDAGARSAPITCSGAPTPSGTGRRSGRSRRCGGSRFRRHAKQAHLRRAGAGRRRRQDRDLRRQRRAPYRTIARGAGLRSRATRSRDQGGVRGGRCGMRSNRRYGYGAPGDGVDRRRSIEWSSASGSASLTSTALVDAEHLNPAREAPSALVRYRGGCR